MSNLGALDMALDDVISQNRSNNRRSNTNNTRRGNNSNSNNRGGISKNRSSGGNRSSPYGGRPSRNSSNNNNNNISAPRNSRNSNSLVVANLHFNVTEKDLYDLFGQIGQLKRAFLHIGPNGKSAGIADVVFVNGNDAERARNTYNNVELDGRPMRITSASVAATVSAVSNNNIGGGGRRSNNLRGGNNNNNDRRGNNNNSRGGGGRGRRDTRPKPSQEDLDAEMDTYMGANNEDTQMN